MFTSEHFVPYSAPNTKLGKRHRALVRENITRNRHKKYLHVGKPGLLRLSWRVGPAPGYVLSSGEVSPDGHSSKEDEASSPRSKLPHRQASLFSSGMLSDNTNDPFSSLPILKWGSLDPSRTLSHLFWGWASIVEYEVGPRSGDVQHPFLCKLLPIAVQNPDLLGAILTDGQYWCDSTMAPVSAVRSVLEYRGQTMIHIRNQLSASLAKNGCVGDATILAIAFLLGVDSYSDDTVSESTHARALQQVVASRGGLCYLDPFVRFVLLTYNLWLQRDSSKPPLFSRDTYANEVQRLLRLSPATPLQVRQAVPRLPITFVRLLERHQISFQLLDLLIRTQEWTATLPRLWVRQATAKDYELFAHCEAFVIVDDVINLRSTMRAELRNPDQVNGLELYPDFLIVLSLILYLLNTMQRTMARSWSIYQESLIEITQLLEIWLCHGDQTEELELQVRNIIIWCSMIAVDSWRQADDVIHPKGLVLMDLLLKSYSAVRRWYVLKRVLQESLWCGGLLQCWHACWEGGQRP